jgi:tetratricopeptide (TPR) repeat protein
MYLRTPKRYTGRPRRRRLISFKRLALWLIALVLIFIGVGIFENRAAILPDVQSWVNNVVDSASSSLSTATAPTPSPTPDPAAQVQQADTYWKQGSIEQALNIYQAVLPALPNDVVAHYRVTLGLVIEGQFDDALKAGEDTVTANPFSSDAWAVRGFALENAGKFGDALASDLQALDLDPNNARAMAFLAETYLDLNQNDRALQTVNKALDLDPNSFEAYRIRGRIIQETQFDNETARKDYQKAYDLAPNMVYPAVDLALVDYSLGDYQSGIQTLSDVISTNPQNAQVLYNLGLLYFRGPGDYNRASDAFARCLGVSPKSIACNYMLGRSQIALNEYDEAAKSFQTTIELGSTDPRHYWWAARSQINRGDCPSAISLLRTGYDLAQKGTDAKLISDYEDIARECQLILNPAAEVTETPTPEKPKK